MTDNPEFRRADSGDLHAIRQLLETAGLPFGDLETAAMGCFLVMKNGEGELLATGGVERYGSEGLLRSVVVNEKQRGGGLGIAIVNALEAGARDEGIRTLYLLTTTAAEFFPRLGYETFDRSKAPEAVANSAEFSKLCPASAVCFRKSL